MNHAIAQVGNVSFTFLNTPSAARLAALGGQNVSLVDRDVNLFTVNPALVSDSLAGTASASYQFYVADIGNSQFVYAPEFKSIGTLVFGVQQMGYGSLQGYDESGIPIGEFKGHETALYISRSHQAGNFRFGATMKGVFSNLGGYRASALALDLGGAFVHPDGSWTVGMAMRNIGVVLKDYSGTGESRLPFDLVVGTTFKPSHMPVRFSVTAHHLDEWGTSNVEEEQTTLDQVFSHLNFAGEILLSKSVNVLVGYNFLTHREFALETVGGTAGLSLGFSIKVKQFELTAARASYLSGTAAYSFSLAGNVRAMIKGKRNNG